MTAQSLAFRYSAFDGEQTKAMGLAFDKVCAGLQISRQSSHQRDILARTLMTLARSGHREKLMLVRLAKNAMENLMAGRRTL